MLSPNANFATILIFICDTFDMTHADMMLLRKKLESVYRNQQFAGAAVVPVSLDALALTAGLLIAFGGRIEALREIKRMAHRKFISIARIYD